MDKHRLPGLVTGLTLGALLLLATGTATPGLASGLRAPSSAAVAASIADFEFRPPTLSVGINDTVTWTNVGQQPHTVTASDDAWTSDTLKNGQTFSRTFTTAGTFAYRCAIHPFMQGTITVAAAVPAPGPVVAPAPPVRAAGPPAPAAPATAAPPRSPSTRPEITQLPKTGDAFGGALPFVGALGLAVGAGGLAFRLRRAR